MNSKHQHKSKFWGNRWFPLINGNYISLKQILLLLLLFASLCLIIARHGSFYEVREYYAINMFESDYELTNKESQEIRQYFVAKQSDLQNVYIKFDIENLVNLKGRLILSIEDSSGEKLASRQTFLSSLTQTETAFWTEFTMACQLEKGQVYSLVIETKDVDTTADASCKLCLSKNRSFLFGFLNIDGVRKDHRMVATFKYNTYCLGDMVAMILLLGLAGIFVLNWYNLSFRHKMRSLSENIPSLPGSLSHKLLSPGSLTCLLSRGLFILTPLVSYFIMQRFSSYNLEDFIDQLTYLQGPINLLLYTLVLLIFYLISNCTKYASVLTVLTIYVLGLANYFVWNFRGSPIVAADFASIGTAKNVANQYSYSLGFDAVWATVLAVTYICLVMTVGTYRGLKVKKRILLLATTALLTSGTYAVFFHTSLMKDLDITVSVWMPERDYAQNGSALSYLLTWTYYVVEKPSGYSVEAVEELTKDYRSDKGSDDSEASKPNIIAIMNESFSDLAVDADIETTEDYMPFIHNLTENTVKGHLYVSVLGGNTANTEFEFLTGNSISFFPARSIPYNSYLKRRTGSLTWTLRDQGYSGDIAIHPYYSDGWNRPTVYPLLGFTDFISQDDFSNNTYVREFISDETDFNRLISEYEKQRQENKDPFYEFTVTMQNHGGYLGTHGLVDESIQVTKPGNANDQITQYLNLIKLSDTALENLINYFSKVKEPTLIVMFGDHQPGFTDSVYDELMGQSTTSLNTEDTAKMYQVPYVIWANYDIEEETLDMSANYLSSYLLKLSGNKMTGYNKYLLDLMKKVPIISAICYQGDDGVLHANGEESQYTELIRQYQMIQYNNMFDTDNRVDNFFFLKN